MKPTFSTRIGKVDLDGLAKHTQKLTDSVAGLMNNGVTVQDNLRMSFITVQAASGQSFQVKDDTLGALAGATAIGYECTVLKTKMRRITSNTLEITITYEGRDLETFILLVFGA